MRKFFAEFFVSRRIESRGVMVRIAVATAATAIAVMILAVAVIMGFRRQISDRITLFTGHIRVEIPHLDPDLASTIMAIDGVVSVEPYAIKEGVAKTAEATQGVVLKGIADSLNGRDVVVSRALGRLLQLAEGDRLEMLFVDGERPRRDLFRVAGFYSSGLDEMDARMVVTSLANIQRLNGWEATQVDGYEVVIDDFGELDEVVGEVWSVVPEGVSVRSVRGEFPQIFDWLATHDVNAAVIIAIMTVVALVSMISALLVMVLERIRMIGVLKTLGMRGRGVRMIFVMRAARILISGLVVGNVLGIGIALLQQRFGLLSLDSEGYFLATVPIELGWWIVWLDVGTVAVILAFLVIPTTIVNRITPSESVRYE